MLYSIRQWGIAHGYENIWHMVWREILATGILVMLIWFAASAMVSGSNLILNHGTDGFITPFGLALDGIQASVHWYESHMTVIPIRESSGAWYGLELPSEWGL